MSSAKTGSRFGERAAYVDASAYVKLVLAETESTAMHATLQRTSVTSSVLMVTEFLRAVLREAPERMHDAVRLLDLVTMVPVTREVVLKAGHLPGSVRSLDAIHLATALEMRQQVGPLITYDKRQAAAAEALGLDVLSPT